MKQTPFSILRALITKNSPYYVQYYIIAQCNLACRMCNIVEANSDLVPASLEDVEKIAKNLRKIGGGIVLLTGGEPFLHQGIHEIVRILVKHGLSPRLQTAGIATRSQLQACYDAGARDINISLDSLIPTKQDRLNGNKKGSWLAAIRAISDVNQVFRTRNRLCALGCVLSKHNYMEIPAILEFATRMGWWLSLVPAHITDTKDARNFRGTDRSFVFDKADHPALDALLKKLIQMKKDYLLFDSEAFLSSTVEYLKTGKVSWRDKRTNVCDSPNLYFAVLPNGDFSVCCDHRYPERLNLAASNFPEVFRSPGFRSNVGKVTSSCSGCNYGSYPEVSLMTRDLRLFGRRSMDLIFRSRPRIPTFNLEECLGIAREIREKYRLPLEVPTLEKERPAAASQRYEGTVQMTRRDALLEWKKNAKELRERAYRSFDQR